jgi:hypothetical protein
LFNVVESSGNYIFEQDTPTTVFRARVIGYGLGGINTSYGGNACINFREGLFD